MSRNRILVIPVLVLLVGCASSMTPRANTREDIVDYVNHAASLVAKSGPSCQTLESPKWRAGDYYVWVLGPDERLLCHPDSSMVGRTQRDVTDANGKRIGEAFITASNSPEGHGWVDYVWPRPGQTDPVAKSAYVRRVTGPDGKIYIVGAGGYQLD